MEKWLLNTMQCYDLYNYYKKYHTPSNAVLAIAGDFDTDEMLVKNHGHFRRSESSTKPVKPTVTPELRRLTAQLVEQWTGAKLYLYKLPTMA